MSKEYIAYVENTFFFTKAPFENHEIDADSEHSHC